MATRGWYGFGAREKEEKGKSCLSIKKIRPGKAGISSRQPPISRVLITCPFRKFTTVHTLLGSCRAKVEQRGSFKDTIQWAYPEYDRQRPVCRAYFAGSRGGACWAQGNNSIFSWQWCLL
jgi:hypothetical protein